MENIKREVKEAETVQVQKVQREMLDQLYVLREQLKKDLENLPSNGGSDTLKREVEVLREQLKDQETLKQENTKLKYRVEILKKSLQEKIEEGSTSK